MKKLNLFIKSCITIFTGFYIGSIYNTDQWNLYLAIVLLLLSFKTYVIDDSTP